MPLKIAVVCEAPADFRTATLLAERALCRCCDWLGDSLEYCPLWWGLEGQGTFLSWKGAAALARARKFHPHGLFGGDPAAPDAHAARKALLILRDRYAELDGVLLIRDDDRQTARRQGLEQARADSPWRDRIVVGLAHCKRECWVLAGFDPLEKAEEELLAAEQRYLGFNPCTEAHQLTAKHDPEHDKRSAKRVLGAMTRRDPDREARCLTGSLFTTLQERGKSTGLADFLAQVETVIGPRLTAKGG